MSDAIRDLYFVFFGGMVSWLGPWGVSREPESTQTTETFGLDWVRLILVPFCNKFFEGLVWMEKSKEKERKWLHFLCFDINF